MKLRNPFTAENRELFRYKYDCDVCGMSGVDALHHILGRVSSSPLNASTVHNHKCHIGNYALDSFDTQARLLKNTLQYLLQEGYVLTPADVQFQADYALYYA